MTSSVRILTTFTLDSSPALLLVSTSGETTLINCGEGCQRSFLETSGLRTRSITRVCLTHIGHDAVGGLGGMVLTTADIAIAAAASAAALAQSGESTPAKRKAPEDAECEDDMAGLDIVGPEGTQAFIHSLRHFMRRDKFRMRVNEGEYRQMPGEAQTRIKAKKRSRKKAKDSDDKQQGFCVQTIPCVHRWTRKSASEPTIETRVLSFIFTTPPIPGKFLPDKARELGIPPGPLYARLKKGETVKFVDGNGVERTVESRQVVAEGSAGVAVAVVYCPSTHVLGQLKESSAWQPLKERGPDSPVLDVVVHMTSRALFASSSYRNWMQSFPQDVEHLWVESAEYLANLGDRTSTVRSAMSPFKAAATGAVTRSLLHPDVFLSPLSGSSSDAGARGADVNAAFVSEEAGLKIIEATSGLEYKLIPRSKKGVTIVATDTAETERKEAASLAAESGALELAKSITVDKTQKTKQGYEIQEPGELIFTGTGSAIPCKQRNVTGMYLKMKTGNSMLLDAGEGTVGQLLRAMDCETDFCQLIQGIKAVWISHPHADHHLGLLRLLSERNALSSYGKDSLVLIAPPNLFAFLEEYAMVDPSVTGSYLPLDCRYLDRQKENPLAGKLFQDLKISAIMSVPVAHCPHSYAVIIHGTPFGKLAYSGDCRPSTVFADAAVDTDLLIHESTFEDGMEDEAVLKRHCTVGEALMVGKQMRAKAVVLTHFSQRYPRIPPLREGASETTIGGSNPDDEYHPRVVFAFDFMKLTPATIVLASSLTPAMRLLYPCEKESNSPNGQDEETRGEPSLSTAEILAIPGLFAQQGLL